MSKIFICYRREDSAHAALAIYMRLEQHFGREHLFMDVDDIPLGVDFRDWLDRQIRQCDLVLVVMGRHWLTAEDANGQRRLDAPRDFVRTEIEIALRRGIPLIPVLLDDAQMPDEAALPASIAPLAYRNAATVHAAGRHFRGHMEHLIRGIEWLLAQPVETPHQTATEQRRRVPDTPIVLRNGNDADALAKQGLSEAQRQAMDHLHREGRLTAADYMTVAQVSHATAVRSLRDMVKRGLLEPRGQGRQVCFVAAARRDSPGPIGDDAKQDPQPGSPDEDAARSNSGPPQVDLAEPPAQPKSSPEIRELLDEVNGSATEPPNRRAVGDRLAELGDPRPGVGVPTEGVERAVAIAIQDRKYGFRIALVPDPSLFTSAHFVLAGQAQLSSELLRNRFPAQVKIGPIDMILHLVKLALPGVALHPLPVAPREIPYRAGFVYFELDRSAELWRQTASGGGFGLHVGGDFPGLQLELWAIRE
ncbi:type VI secretion system baseplate subunit TssK [Thiohalocapsa sp. ML1]|uniref:type VI secretion system baseplate subunit TssK n=1 Tax=Thiohalocapsa sp. ML1 TaxID=1431688 RepID=UPI0007323E32|nr:type VI secretion system baseplate subunit TssK [Thiohalocapsa sp. ML1]